MQAVIPHLPRNYQEAMTVLDGRDHLVFDVPLPYDAVLEIDAPGTGAVAGPGAEMVCFRAGCSSRCELPDLNDQVEKTILPAFDVLWEGDTGSGYVFASVSPQDWQVIVERVEAGQSGRVITWQREPAHGGTFDFSAVFTPSEMTGLIREVLAGIVSRDHPALTIAQAIDLARAIAE